MRSKEKNMDLTSTENEAAKKAKKADKWADKPAMEVRDLHFSYGKNKVLKGVSLKIEEGKITTIMGANGCGKSTLFSLMTKNLFGITIIMVLHDINQAIAYSDNVIGMKDGKVLVEGDPEEVITEESIRELYGIELGVTRVDGRKFVLAV